MSKMVGVETICKERINLSNKQPIGIFDSGVGGLTVFKEIKKLLPSENLIYFGDTARVPYGGKSAQIISNYSLQIAAFLQSLDVKLLVVACNSASALALPALKNNCNIPVIGVIEPGVRAAVNRSSTGPIGVIGTRATIFSQVYQKGINQLAPNLEVIARPCPLFVPIVEENLMNTEIAEKAVQMYLSEFKEARVSSLILACTHYPLLKDQFRKALSSEVEFIDSALETANEVKQLLENHKKLANPEHIGTSKFYVSDSVDNFKQIATTFLSNSISNNCFQHSWTNCE